jgi:hypothetical protein
MWFFYLPNQHIANVLQKSPDENVSKNLVLDQIFAVMPDRRK